MIPMKSAEVLDRLTILLQKVRLDQSVSVELEQIRTEAEVVLKCYPQASWSLLQLMEANSKIWMLEASLRQEFKGDPANTGELPLEEVGRRALQIRDLNRLRIEAKNEISRITREAGDPKVCHASSGSETRR